MWTVAALGIVISWIGMAGPLRRTTLFSAWFWLGMAAVSALGFASADLPSDLAGDRLSANHPWRLIAATSASCPFVAILGAKRPHHVAWQFIVATFWIVLAWPAWEALAFGNRGVNLDTLRSAGCWILLAMTWFNWWGTRYWLAVTLGVMGQGLLYAPFLCGSHLLGMRIQAVPISTVEVCLILWTLGAMLGCLQLRSLCWPPTSDLESYSQLWRAWRNLYGVIWGFRVLERIQETARIAHWPVDLTWSKFVPRDTQEFYDCRGIDVSMRSLLRRFLDDDCFPDRPGESPRE
ncbi:MAG: hypothetical protein O2931_07145 [Planctomycetota bacterium]|nr:hypothetical protein [Planctomycetota bacterium]MDA1178556.1 hypothetical protein [Planctomycetota bacterium]